MRRRRFGRRDRWALCPICGDTITWRISEEWEGEGYWRGIVQSLDELVQECSCPLGNEVLEELFRESQEVDWWD
jgi:hypothetical protein